MEVHYFSNTSIEKFSTCVIFLIKITLKDMLQIKMQLNKFLL